MKPSSRGDGAAKSEDKINVPLANFQGFSNPNPDLISSIFFSTSLYSLSKTPSLFVSNLISKTSQIRSIYSFHMEATRWLISAYFLSSVENLSPLGQFSWGWNFISTSFISLYVLCIFAHHLISTIYNLPVIHHNVSHHLNLLFIGLFHSDFFAGPCSYDLCSSVRDARGSDDIYISAFRVMDLIGKEGGKQGCHTRF